MPFQHIPKVGPVIVAGGVLDSVGQVLDPVSTDPASTIAVVSSSVPFPFRDIAFWPALSGEQFGPVLAAGASYGSYDDHPAYIAAGAAGSAGAVVTGPNLPRVGFNGKQNLTLHFVLTLTYTPNAPGADQPLFVLGLGKYTGARCAGFRIDSYQHASHQWAVRPGYVSPSGVEDWTGGQVGLAEGAEHTLQVTLNADGTIGPWLLDGNSIRARTAAALWNTTGSGQPACWSIYNLGLTGWGNAYLSAAVQQWS